MGLTGIFGGKRGRLLATGQTTAYSSELDDGHYEKGLTKTYTVLTTGGYSGTSNMDLIHKTAATIAFVNGTSKITDSGSDLAMFKTGETIIVSGAAEAGNNGTFTIATGNVAGEIVVNETLTDEVAGATVSIAKREAHSNNCVLDRQTGLMWSRYTSFTYATMGTAGNGKMPWTGQLYDIFQYCAAANAVSLGGYTDWRVPHDMELASLRNMEVPSALPDAAAFPGWVAEYHWASTTRPSDTTRAVFVSFGAGFVSNNDKSTLYYAALVRGGV